MEQQVTTSPQLYDLNINSIIVSPEHGQWIDDPLANKKRDMSTQIKGCGFAHFWKVLMR